MSSSGSDQVGLGKIWLHRPFNITPASNDALPNPSISHCLLPTKNPKPASENRWHNLYHQSTASALEHNLLSKQEFFKAQFSSRVTKEDAARRIQKRRLQQSCSKTREVDVTIYLPSVASNDDNASESNEKLQGICLHVHGGGWIVGDSRYQVGHRCLEMSDALNAAVVSVEYTLTTSNNDNGQIFDPVSEVVSAIDWIETAGSDELNAEPIFVASGESAGAHLLLLSMLKCRDRPQRISSWKCLNLVYGFFDLSGTPSVRTDGNESSPISGDELLFMADMYCSKLKGGSNNDDQRANHLDRRDPSISPFYANLSNLPPALFTVGSADPLLDDSLFLASRYCVDGNNYAELVIYEGGEHGIGHFGLQEDVEMGNRAREYTYEFMKHYLI